MKKLIVSLMLLTTVISCNSQEQLQSKGNGAVSGEMSINSEIESMPLYDLSDEQVNSLLFMWEEEKVARDVYLTLGQLYNQRIFSNISSSEQKHMNAVKSLITKYGIPLIGTEEVGVFHSPEFQNLYNELVERGRNSLAAALDVGRDIELMDIADLEREIGGATPDMQMVYENLMAGSYNHLAAFERNLSRLQNCYTASQGHDFLKIIEKADIGCLHNVILLIEIYQNDINGGAMKALKGFSKTVLALFFMVKKPAIWKWPLGTLEVFRPLHVLAK